METAEHSGKRNGIYETLIAIFFLSVRLAHKFFGIKFDTFNRLVNNNIGGEY